MAASLDQPEPDRSVEPSEELSSRNTGIIALLFFLSGASSLVYQVIWTRQMVFVFGSSTFASATVLCAFMGGLALGSLIASRIADRLKNPFRTYGILELIIGVTAILTPFLFDAAIPLYKSMWQSLHLQVLQFSLLRFVVVSLILLLPTSCMGATLPILSRFVARSLSTVGDKVGALYSINTFGAVIGALAAGFCLIPSLGLSTTNCIAAATNLLLGLAVWTLAKEMPSFVLPKEPSNSGESPVDANAGADSASKTSAASLQADPNPDSDPNPASDPHQSSKPTTASDPNQAASDQDRASEGNDGDDEVEYLYDDLEIDTSISKKAVIFTMIAFGLSGAVAMIYEVAWTRQLCMIIGSTTYAFTIMLVTFLTGIFLGSLLLSRFADKVKDPVFGFSLAQSLLAAAGVLSIYLFNYLPYWNLVANTHFPADPVMGMLLRFLLASLILLPISLCLGAGFPLAVKICTAELERVGKSVGTLYSVNTFGAIIGAFSSGFFIIPYLGNEQTLIVCTVVSALSAALLMVFFSRAWFVFKFLGLASSIIFLVWAQQNPKIWDNSLVTTSQRLRRALLFMDKNEKIGSYSEWAEGVRKSFELAFYKDGICSNVAIAKFNDDHSTSLFTNGHIDASDNRLDMYTQTLLAAIPLFLNPEAEDVANVGWGSGVTLGYALAFPIKKAVCAEIEPDVVLASRYFRHVNHSPEEDKRTEIEYNDGRNYLLATDNKFDVIMSEPSNPWQVGVCNLYTKEYFKVCHDRLKPGGVFAMWWQCNEVSKDNLVKVFAALKKVYKHICVYRTHYPGSDIIVLASDASLKIQLDKLERALGNQRLQAFLIANSGISVTEDLPMKVCMSDEGVDKVIANVPANTDDRNYIEFEVSKTHEQKNFAEDNFKWMKENAGPVWDCVDWSLFEAPRKAIRMAAIADCGIAKDNPDAEVWADESFRVYPNAYALCVKALAAAQRSTQEGYDVADKAVKQSDEHPIPEFPDAAKPYFVKGLIALAGGAPMKARKSLEIAHQRRPFEPDTCFRLAQTYLPDLKDWYQKSDLTMKDDGVADENAQKVIDILATSPAMDPKGYLYRHPEAQATLGVAFIRAGKINDGVGLLQEFQSKYVRDDILSYKILKDVYLKQGNQLSADHCKKQIEYFSKQRAAKMADEAKTKMKVDKLEAAYAHLKRALEYWPSSYEARTVLETLAGKYQDAQKLNQELSKVAKDPAAASSRP